MNIEKNFTCDKIIDYLLLIMVSARLKIYQAG